MLSLRTGLSNKYDKEKSLEHIKNRYENGLKHFHLTLEYYKDYYFFHDWIQSLREAGWLDWHICMGLMNAILSTKANKALADKTFKTDEEFGEAFQKLYAEYLNGTEDDNFEVIPLGDLMGKFDFEMDVYKAKFLLSFGLSDKPQFPNFNAIADFTRNRLNFFEDDISKLSPLRDIGDDLSE